MIKYKGASYHCSIELTLSLIGGKWKCLILWYLGENTLRFIFNKFRLDGLQSPASGREHVNRLKLLTKFF
jgi:DNA-binding HxlR family transcriptional regulator